MGRPLNYHTKQLEAILQYIASPGSGHVTAAQIMAHFAHSGARIGRATVYRHLDKLTESGHVRRYTIDGISGACFQYTGQCEDCPLHLHLKCEACGKLIHLDCELLPEIARHMLHSHSFQINPAKTVLYGQCKSCQSL